MEKENESEDNYSQYLLNRKLKVLIADDEKKMVEEILSNMNEENEDYEIVGYALSNEEERQKIQELKPDVVITDIYRGELGQKNAGGYEIIKEYSEKYLVPKFIVISYTPEFKNQNIVGEFNKYPNINYDGIKKLLKSVKIAERSSFIYGYKRIGNNEENSKKKVTFFDKLKSLLLK